MRNWAHATPPRLQISKNDPGHPSIDQISRAFCTPDAAATPFLPLPIERDVSCLFVCFV